MKRIAVVESQGRCCVSPGDKLLVETESGYISSSVTAETGCGSSTCPWLIQAPSGQSIEIFLWDFEYSKLNWCIFVIDGLFLLLTIFVWVAVYANYNTIFSNPNTICWEWVDGCWLVKLNSSTITYVLLTCPKVTFERVCFNLPKEVFCFVLFLARIHVFVLFLAKIHVARLAQEYISHIFITQLYEQPLVAALYCIISILEHSTMHIYLLCVK